MRGKQKQSCAKMPRTTIHLICGSHAVLTGKQSDRMSNSNSQPQVLEEEKKEREEVEANWFGHCTVE